MGLVTQSLATAYVLNYLTHKRNHSVRTWGAVPRRYPWSWVLIDAVKLKVRVRQAAWLGRSSYLLQGRACQPQLPASISWCHPEQAVRCHWTGANRSSRAHLQRWLHPLRIRARWSSTICCAIRSWSCHASAWRICTPCWSVLQLPCTDHSICWQGS